VLLALARPAAADDGVVSVPRRTVAVGFAGQGIPVGGLGQAGGGPSFEVALGDGRWQYFVEAGLMWVGVRSAGQNVDGILARGGVGVRWIARAFEVDTGGGIEMALEAVSGLEQLWWLQGGRLTRPEIGAGVAWQVRRYRRPMLAFRFGIRAMFAPATRSLMATCDACSRHSAATPGLMGSLGVAW
jgi:hypothetical protein